LSERLWNDCQPIGGVCTLPEATITSARTSPQAGAAGPGSRLIATADDGLPVSAGECVRDVLRGGQEHVVARICPSCIFSLSEGGRDSDNFDPSHASPSSLEVTATDEDEFNGLPYRNSKPLSRSGAGHRPEV
jgi:hypothetical protein